MEFYPRLAKANNLLHSILAYRFNPPILIGGCNLQFFEGEMREKKF